MSEIQNKVVIITGASSGLGAATAERLAASGAKLMLAARREDRSHPRRDLQALPQAARARHGGEGAPEGLDWAEHTWSRDDGERRVVIGRDLASQPDRADASSVPRTYR